MTGEDFVAELLVMVNDFCRTLETQPPAYSYIPLTSDEERIRVMKSRLYNDRLCENSKRRPNFYSS